MKSVFGDNDRYIDLLFRLLYKDNILLTEWENSVVSMAFLLPAYVLIDKVKVPITYLYACATDPHFRGKGFMRKIIEKAYCDSSRNKQAGLFLLPATDSLYDFYAESGFRNFFYYQEKKIKRPGTFNAGFSPKPVIKKLTGREYYMYRSSFLKENYSIHYPQKHFELMQYDYENGNDGFYRVGKEDDPEGLFFMNRQDSVLELKELLIRENKITETALTDLLFSEFDVSDLRIVTPGDKKRSAMIRLNKDYEYLYGKKGYFNFPLD